MTHRERVLAVLKGEKADMVPWFGDMDYFTTAEINRGKRPKDFKESDQYIEWHRAMRCGFYLQGYFPFKEIVENCDVREWKDGDRRYRRIVTPRGALQECWLWSDITYSEAPIERLLKTPEELEAYSFLYANTRYEPDYALAEKRRRQVGDMGVVLCYLPRTPFMRMVAIDAGIENVTMIHADAPDEFGRMFAVVTESLDRASQVALQSPAEILMMPENLSSESVGPRFFELFLKDFQTRWSRKIIEAGKFSCIHMDGTMVGLLRQESQVGLTFIEAMTPKPVGDIAIGEWASFRGGSNTIYWGGIPGSYFTPLVDDREFDRHVREVLSVMREDRRMVLGVADQVPPDGMERRVCRVQELVESFGDTGSRMKKDATISDIALKAGVSKSTVSRALSGSTRISAATRTRIASAAKKLHYEPNYLARNLSRSRTLSVGVVLEDIMNPFFTEVAKGIETVLNEGGYSMLLTSSGYVPGVELELTRTLLRNRVDGVLLTPVSMESPSLRLLRARRVPFFVMNEKSADRELNWIDSDNRAGGAMAAEFLLKLGHRRFVILTNSHLHGTRDRFAGIIGALDARRVPETDRVIVDGAVNRKDGTRLMDGVIEARGRGGPSAGLEGMPSAVIAVNDLIAIGAMESLLAHGYDVPGQVSIIGYDDISLAGLVRVPLTTVHQAKYRMGQIAAAGLLRMLDGSQPARGQQFLIKPRLIIRDSCKEQMP